MNPLDWLAGSRTYIAAAIVALVAFEQALDAAGVGLIPEHIEAAILAAAAALGLYGLRAAIGTNGNGKNK